MARPAERPARPSPRAAVALSFVICSALAAGGCTQRALVGRENALGPDAAVAYDAAPFDGLGYIDGKLHAHAEFNKIGSVFWFGGDNDPSRLEVWIYEDAPTCADVSTPGWITTVRPTDLMGITVGGAMPGTYQVAAQNPPAAGSAYLLHVIDQADPVIESEGESGSVTITSVKPGESLSGAFEATFSTGTLQGAFNAVWCPTGVGL